MDSLLHRVRRTLMKGLCVASAACLVGVGPASAAPGELDRWTPASPAREDGFVTFELAWSDGQITTTTVAGATLPMRFAVEQELVSRVGRSPIDAGVTAWNGISGSRFAAYVDRIVDDRVRSPSIDGVNHLDRATFQIRRGLHRVPKKAERVVERSGLVPSKPKTEDSGSRLPMSRQAVELLRQHRERQDGELAEIGLELTENSCVFTSTVGTPLDHSNVLKQWKDVLREAGVDYWTDDGRGRGLHELRRHVRHASP